MHGIHVCVSPLYRLTYHCQVAKHVLEGSNQVRKCACIFLVFQGGLTFLAVQRYRLGAQEAFNTGYDQDPNASSPYSSFPGSDSGDPYQQPPFSQQKEAPDYQPPTY